MKLCVVIRERANLAVTLASGRGEVVGHACFLDHPIAGLVDQEHWESYLHKHFHAGAHTVGLPVQGALPGAAKHLMLPHPVEQC